MKRTALITTTIAALCAMGAAPAMASGKHVSRGGPTGPGVRQHELSVRHERRQPLLPVGWRAALLPRSGLLARHAQLLPSDLPT